jgi:uncharacterized DUF497 family protein
MGREKEPREQDQASRWLRGNRGFRGDTALVFIDDRDDYGELREVAIGFIGMRLYNLVFVSKDDDTLRIVSLRPANRMEARRYEQGC